MAGWHSSGLLMALIEIHSPHLSTRVEAALDYLHDRFVCYSDKVQQQQDRIKKLYLQSKYRKRFLQIISLSFLAFLLSGLAFGIYDDPSRLTLLETVIMSLPGIVFFVCEYYVFVGVPSMPCDLLAYCYRREHV
jgi:hypothetical protein